MAKYKRTCPDRGKLLSVYLSKQLVPGTFEHTLSRLIDNELDLSVFDARYRNDETGAPAFAPRILLKIILFSYSRGIVSSRKIAQACEENVVFIALSEDTRPHFTTIADFISSLDRDHLPISECSFDLRGDGFDRTEMFAIDGCKLPSNASKKWSGTRADFEKRAAKLEKVVEHIVKKHRANDLGRVDMDLAARAARYAQTLHKRVEKIRAWLACNEDKLGKTNKAITSNMTDNESAKMKTTHGVIQGSDESERCGRRSPGHRLCRGVRAS